MPFFLKWLHASQTFPISRKPLQVVKSNTYFFNLCSIFMSWENWAWSFLFDKFYNFRILKFQNCKIPIRRHNKGYTCQHSHKLLFKLIFYSNFISLQNLFKQNWYKESLKYYAIQFGPSPDPRFTPYHTKSYFAPLPLHFIA